LSEPAAPERIAGIAFIKIDGSYIPLRGRFTVSPSTVERVAGVHSYQELPRIPTIDGDVSSVDGLEDLEAYSLLDGVNVVVELCNGKVYVLRDACISAGLEHREGHIRMRFEGITCEEVGS
jgi:Phage tail tube protein